MKYALKSCKRIKYFHDNKIHDYVIGFSKWITNSRIQLTLYSYSILTLSDEQSLNMICDIFKNELTSKNNIIIELDINKGLLKTRRDKKYICFLVEIESYFKMRKLYDGMETCFVYNDKILSKDKLKIFNNISVKNENVLDVYDNIEIKSKDGHIFYNDELIVSYGNILSKKSISKNRFSIYFNDE